MEPFGRQGLTVEVWEASIVIVTELILLRREEGGVLQVTPTAHAPAECRALSVTWAEAAGLL
jgi:hypothetical protein